MKKLIGILLVAGGMIMGRPVVGADIVLTPVADTSLFEQSPTNNLGGFTNCPTGSNNNLLRSRALLRFDVAGQLPTNAIIQSAALTVNVIVVPTGGGTPSTFDLRRMLVSWTEGTGTTSSGQGAKTGESTWNNQAYPATPWSTPGGAISIEYSSTVSSSVAMNAAGGYTFVSTANLVADVQQWVANPGTNFGWAVFSESEGGTQSVRRFGSRESGALAPSLAINYTIPQSGPTLQNAARVGNQFQFTFSAAAGQGYNVQYSDTLAPGGWSNFLSVSPPAVATDIAVTDSPATNGQRFYRVIAPF